MQPIQGLSLIVAMALNRVIGRDNDLPWKIPSDSKRFRDITMGHPVIMGRKNWESIPQKYRPLSGRTNVVLTRKENYLAEGATVVRLMEHALEIARDAPGADEIFIIGGEDVYRQFLPLVHRMYITSVFAAMDGDTRFPDFPLSEWQLIKVTELKKWRPDDGYQTSFAVYQR